MAIITISLFIESEDQTVELLASKIGVPASAGWTKGDSRGKTGKVYTTNSWKQVERVVTSDDPDQFVATLQRAIATVLERVVGHEREFRQVASSSTSGLVIGISSKQVPPLILNAELLERVAVLGIDCEVDLTLD